MVIYKYGEKVKNTLYSIIITPEGMVDCGSGEQQKSSWRAFELRLGTNLAQYILTCMASSACGRKN